MSCCNKPVRTIVETPPAELPITKEEVKAQKRMSPTDTSLDSLIDLYIQAATKAAEKWTGLTFILTGFRSFYEVFAQAVLVPGRPLIAVNTVEYKFGGSLQILDPSAYTIFTETNGATILPVNIWPTLDDDVSDRVQVAFDLGYADAATFSSEAPDIKLGLLQLVVLMLDNPGDCCMPEDCIPKTLLNNYRRYDVRGGLCGL